MRGSIVKRVSKQKDANGKPAPLYYVVRAELEKITALARYKFDVLKITSRTRNQMELGDG